MSISRPLVLAGVVPALCLIVATVPALAHERMEAPERVLRAHKFSAGTKIALRPEFDRPMPKTATFLVTYVGFPAGAQAAFQQAVDIWSALITSSVPIRVRAAWEPLDPDVLGGASANFINRDFPGAPMPGTWYVDALADAVGGSDLGGGDFDVLASFNSTFTNWSFGPAGNPASNEFDLLTVVLHEIGHGLGMSGSMFVDATGNGTWGFGSTTLFPMVYDVFAEDFNGISLLDPVTYPNPSFVLGDVLQDQVFFDGPMAVAAHGSRPELYAQDPFLAGSSYSHFDEALFGAGTPNGLMTPFLAMDEVIHDPGDVTLCLLEDLGWNTEAICGTPPPPPPPPPPGDCVPSDTVICLRDGRFAVEVDWRKFDDETGLARKVTQSDDSTLLYFFNPSNWEMLIKVLNGCNNNTNHFWVFAAATTNVEYTLRVTDTQAQETMTYFNPLGMDSPAITDTSAFDTCP